MDEVLGLTPCDHQPGMKTEQYRFTLKDENIWAQILYESFSSETTAFKVKHIVQKLEIQILV